MTISIGQSARRWLACAIIIAAIAAGLPAAIPSATAADMSARPGAVAAPLWTSFYFGVHGGGAWGTSRVEDPSFRFTYDPIDVKSSGPIAGGQLGADWQFGQFVVGGEIDASWASVRGSATPDPTLFPISGFATKFRALATGTARVGYAFGSWLAYAKGGVAWADIEFTARNNTPSPLVIPHHRTGLTAGAGLEVAIWRNLSAKLEYNAMYFGSTATDLGFSRNTGNVDHLLHVVKGGVNVRFGGDQLTARY